MARIVDVIDLRGEAEGCGLNPITKLLASLRGLKQGEALEVVGDESLVPLVFLEDVAKSLNAELTIEERKDRVYKVLISKK